MHSRPWPVLLIVTSRIPLLDQLVSGFHYLLKDGFVSCLWHSYTSHFQTTQLSVLSYKEEAEYVFIDKFHPPHAGVCKGH